MSSQDHMPLSQRWDDAHCNVKPADDSKDSIAAAAAVAAGSVESNGAANADKAAEESPREMPPLPPQASTEPSKPKRAKKSKRRKSRSFVRRKKKPSVPWSKEELLRAFDLMCTPQYVDPSQFPGRSRAAVLKKVRTMDVLQFVEERGQAAVDKALAARQSRVKPTKKVPIELQLAVDAAKQGVVGEQYFAPGTGPNIRPSRGSKVKEEDGEEVGAEQEEVEEQPNGGKRRRSRSAKAEQESEEEDSDEATTSPPSSPSPPPPRKRKRKRHSSSSSSSSARNKKQHLSAVEQAVRAFPAMSSADANRSDMVLDNADADIAEYLQRVRAAHASNAALPVRSGALLYHNNDVPAAQARISLRLCDVEFEERRVDSEETHAALAAAVGSSCNVPALVWRGTVVASVPAILSALDKTTDAPLLPDNAVCTNLLHLLCAPNPFYAAAQHGPFSPSLNSFFTLGAAGPMSDIAKSYIQAVLTQAEAILSLVAARAAGELGPCALATALPSAVDAALFAVVQHAVQRGISLKPFARIQQVTQHLTALPQFQPEVDSDHAAVSHRARSLDALAAVLNSIDRGNPAPLWAQDLADPNVIDSFRIPENILDDMHS